MLEEYGKNKKLETVGKYTYDETNKMVQGVNASGESSSYLYNGLGALVENTWVIAKNSYGYHDVDATAEVAEPNVEQPGIMPLSNGNGGGNGNGQGNGNGKGDKPTGSDVKKTSTVVKQFVVDYTTATFEPLTEHEVNGLDYRYVYGNDRLSVNITGVETSSGNLIENGNQIRLYYHMDLLGTTDYLTSPVSQKVTSWTHYNEWGEITHNAVLKSGKRELDLVKRYATHDYDAVLNMYYAKARMYDAENRRFAAMDPVPFREYVKTRWRLVLTKKRFLSCHRSWASSHPVCIWHCLGRGKCLPTDGRQDWSCVELEKNEDLAEAHICKIYWCHIIAAPVFVAFYKVCENVVAKSGVDCLYK